MVIYMYMYADPGSGQMCPWCLFLLRIFSSIARFVQDFSFECQFKSFAHSCWKIGEGYHWIMIYIYIVIVKSLMLHAKFR